MRRGFRVALPRGCGVETGPPDLEPGLPVDAFMRMYYRQQRRWRVEAYFLRLLDEHKAARGAILTVTPVPVRTR